ncbi:TlpA family protein disulfide reductase [Plantactinospora sp. GCM10030261]|uniref:TlpA family protein disulfide reductase n=1 Tax=Plantactinospora sp. GCM10030261 TaxID=3273420 RepID=UPI003617577C
MPFLTAAVVLVGALGLVNLLLTLGLTRRMRQYGHLLDGLEPAERGASTRPVGSDVSPFTATAVDGTVVGLDWFREPTLVGFFSPGCSACKDVLPGFVAAAATKRALAVVEKGPEPADEYVEPLAKVATVLVDDQAHEAITAFAVRAFPAVCAVDSQGVITETGVQVARPSAAVPA